MLQAAYLANLKNLELFSSDSQEPLDKSALVSFDIETFTVTIDALSTASEALNEGLNSKAPAKLSW